MMNSRSKALSLLKSANPKFDLTNQRHQEQLLDLSDDILILDDLSVEDLQQLSHQYDAPLAFQLAIKLVESRRYLLSITQQLKLAVVFAMWGEHNRLEPKDANNPNGEDSLRTKVTQLEWATKDTKVEWSLYAVDDGCPHNSAQIAREIANGMDYELENALLPYSQCSLVERLHILELSDALPTKSGPLANLANANDSRKGGAIILGCQSALDNGADAVVYTDADNSVHLGQLGLILQPYVEQGKSVVLGNRKHKNSILVKQEERWGAGIKTLRHMQRMIGSPIFEHGIKDTQAAFKLYDRNVLKEILKKPTVYDFSFDTDWILAAMEINQPIDTIPFAFIDSVAESASIVQGPMTTWYVLLDGLVKAAQARKADYSKEMADVFNKEIKSHEDLELIIDVVPPELVRASDSDLGDPKIMSPQSVRNWILSAKMLQAQIDTA
ncbi:glycosyltransferase [Vibrio sinensis]|uniref:Glycosyltransferase n=1 Tax=Vibrio sinensis TaxID=2302434 RepID=A0A3A6QLC6_9VIBR|nr:glycosyltransferase [Vibrio sinensis]RJX71393.1 glycosyltransferase [Vibrio sinensis]